MFRDGCLEIHGDSHVGCSGHGQIERLNYMLTAPDSRDATIKSVTWGVPSAFLNWKMKKHVQILPSCKYAPLCSQNVKRSSHKVFMVRRWSTAQVVEVAIFTNHPSDRSPSAEVLFCQSPDPKPRPWKAWLIKSHQGAEFQGFQVILKKPWTSIFIHIHPYSTTIRDHLWISMILHDIISKIFHDIPLYEPRKLPVFGTKHYKTRLTECSYLVLPPDVFEKPGYATMLFSSLHLTNQSRRYGHPRKLATMSLTSLVEHKSTPLLYKLLHAGMVTESQARDITSENSFLFDIIYIWS